jgi:hypothetical protein
MLYTVLYTTHVLIFCINVQLLLIMSFGQADESKFLMDRIAYKKDYT